MLPPLIRRPQTQATSQRRSKQRGFTMALVAASMVAIIAMAALSIDVGTLYQAKAEAQRGADAAALTAARVISISGITGDPTQGSSDGSWNAICGGSASPASLAAINVAQQNLINGAAPSTVTVNYGVGSAGASSATCVGLGAGFAINPVVKVYVQQARLPTFFARVFSLISGGTSSNSGVSATATAEVFNPSDSGTLAGTVIPVQPRCVKPWIVPNADPGNGGAKFVHLGSGRIASPGISQLAGGVIGEGFKLSADCTSPGTPGACTLIGGQAPTATPGAGITGTLQYIPALISGTPAAVPACSLNPGFQSDIAGCDTSTVYACGTANGAQYDLTENPVNPTAASGDTATAVECLINNSAGRDSLASYPAVNFPFQIQAGFGNPLVQAGVVNSGDTITTSNSIVTIPIYNGNGGTLPPQVTIVGFLQVFIEGIDAAGNINVTVLNVAGCSDDATSASVFGTSPVPIRLITPP